MTKNINEHQMNWLTIKNLAGEGDQRKAELWIDGIIGYKDWMDDSGTTAAEFIRTVNALGDLNEIDIFINTPGGVVSDGVTITNYLINHKASISMTVMGQAASIGSVIVQAADPGKLHMALGSTMFVHDPLTVIVGNADDMRAAANQLDKVRDSIISVYQRRTDMSVEDIQQLMKDETMMTAEESVTWGFADSMDAELKAVACTSLLPVIRDAQEAYAKNHKPSGAAGHNIGGNKMPNPNDPAAKPPVINRAFLDENHADIVASIRQEATEAANQDGVTAERARVVAILGTPMANLYGDLVSNAIAEGTTPEQFALAILAAEDKVRTDTFANHKADAPAAMDEPVEVDTGLPANASIEDIAQAKWDKSPELQEEFGKFSTYLAFAKAEAKGAIKTHGKK